MGCLLWILVRKLTTLQRHRALFCFQGWVQILSRIKKNYWNHYFPANKYQWHANKACRPPCSAVADRGAATLVTPAASCMPLFGHLISLTHDTTSHKLVKCLHVAVSMVWSRGMWCNFDLVFQRGEFVVEKNDINQSRFPIWKIDGGRLLQKFEPFECDGRIRHKPMTTVSNQGITPACFEKKKVI